MNTLKRRIKILFYNYLIQKLRITQARKQAKRDPSCFETQGRLHQKFKTGVSVVPQKGIMSSKYLKQVFHSREELPDSIDARHHDVVVVHYFQYFLIRHPSGE